MILPVAYPSSFVRYWRPREPVWQFVNAFNPAAYRLNSPAFGPTAESFYTNLVRDGVWLLEVMRDHSQNEWCEQLYEAKAAQLILYGRAIGLSHNESEDLVQETFIALLKLPAAPENRDGYLYRAFRNRAVNYKRGLWRRITRELEAKGWFESDSEQSPLEGEAMRVLQRLPAEQREVIVLKIWNQQTLEQIGELLDLSPNTVAGRYRYGIQKLRQALKGIDYERLESFDRRTIAELEASPTFG